MTSSFCFHPIDFLEKNRDTLSANVMQVVHSSKNKFLKDIFQVETTPSTLGRGTIRHLGADQAYKVGLLAQSCRNKSFLLPSLRFWLFLTSSFFCKSLSLSFNSFLQSSLQEKPESGVHTVNKCNVSPVSQDTCVVICAQGCGEPCPAHSENKAVKRSRLETAWGRVQVLCPAATF